MDEPALLPAPGRRLRRNGRSPTRSGFRPDARLAQRGRTQAEPRHHESQPHARRAEQRQLRRVQRVAVLDHRDGRALGRPALGLAGRRPPPDHQLLRARRSGRHDTAVHRLRAGHRRVREVQGHRDHAAGAGPGSRADPLASGRAAGEGDHRDLEGRQQQPRRGVQRQHRARLRRHRSLGTFSRSKGATARPDRHLRPQHARGTRQGADGRGRGPSR